MTLSPARSKLIKLTLVAIPLTNPLLQGCVETSIDVPAADQAPSVTQLFSVPESQRFRTLGDDYAEDEAVVARVAGARLTSDGNRVVLLDNVPPFVKVFSADGSFVRGFLRRGEGPGEARAPFGVATASGGRVLVIHDRHASVFDSGGRFISRVSFEAMGFHPLAATGGCDDEWIFYGPRSLRSDGVENGWLYRQPVEDNWSLPAEPIHADTIYPTSIGFGAHYSLDATDGRIIFGHKYANPETVLRVSCGSSAADELKIVSRISSKHLAREERSGNQMALSITAGERSLVGSTLLDAGILLAHRVHAGNDDATRRTELTLIRDDSVFRAGTPMRLSIQDGAPEIGALFSTAGLVPRVFLVPDERILAAFRRVPERNRTAR